MCRNTTVWTLAEENWMQGILTRKIRESKAHKYIMEERIFTNDTGYHAITFG